MRILIVGSGIAGQTLACALARRGIACDMVELKPAFDIAGAGLYVQGPALRAFLDIGVVEAIVAQGEPLADDYSLACDVAGNVLAAPTYPRIAGPSIPAVVPIRRKVLHDILAAAVESAGVKVRMGVTVEAIDDTGPAARVSFTDGTAGEYDLVVGADGIRSRVRSLVFETIEPVFTGYANWRVILPRPAGLERTTWMMGPGTSFGIIPIARDTVYVGGVTKEPGNPRYPREQLPALCREKFAAYGGLVPALLAQVADPGQVVYTPIEEILMPAPWHRGRVVVPVRPERFNGNRPPFSRRVAGRHRGARQLHAQFHAGRCREAFRHACRTLRVIGVKEAVTIAACPEAGPDGLPGQSSPRLMSSRRSALPPQMRERSSSESPGTERMKSTGLASAMS